MTDEQRLIAELVTDRDNYRALYEAGCASWGVVYDEVLKRAEAAESQLAEAQSELAELKKATP